ncbi:DUF1998 domain-containing protein [Sphaerospermopsis sp. FACHB-1094]|uniref:DUF1998 domain-containing protein n=1 Tax=Sphaerospermopsis sp. FACHB-1094 TaxID=2692861 RepID=UPI003220601A
MIGKNKMNYPVPSPQSPVPSPQSPVPSPQSPVTSHQPMPKHKKRLTPLAEIRQSQLLNTYGPGSMVDLPEHSVIIGGLSFWKGEKQYIREDRLKNKVQEILELQEPVNLYSPPRDNPDSYAPDANVGVFIFPTWFVAQVEKTVRFHGKDYRTRPLVTWREVKSGLKFDGKSVNAVPIRFVQGCANGHISDINWYAFAHNDFNTKCKHQLWLDEGGSGNDFEEIFVRCEVCKGARRPLSQAKLPKSRVLGPCQGDRPWLGYQGKQNDCYSCVIDKTGNIVKTKEREYNRLLVRSASNAYFAQTLSVISIPDLNEHLKKTIDCHYEDLQYLEEINDLRGFLLIQKKNPKYADLITLDVDAIWAEIQRRNNKQSSESKTIKQVELEALLNCEETTGKEHDDFYATNRKLDHFPSELLPYIERVVLVHRLREVIAQIGFTRFEASLPDIEGEIDKNLTINVQRAALDLETKWIPAIENKGEGVFIGFHKQVIEEWQEKEVVKARGRKLVSGLKQWCLSKNISEDQVKFPGLPYIMLHSLSHLLITTVSLECGYAASAIRERIYANPDTGYGILLYTGSPGSEGTLGGLVEVGNNIEYHLKIALETGKLCSNDPVCSQHQPDNLQEERFLHGAACHGCLLIAETSCEWRNEFLDRALIVPTLENLGCEFFLNLGE